jgi:hypothetical protein
VSQVCSGLATSLIFGVHHLEFLIRFSSVRLVFFLYLESTAVTTGLLS